MRYHKTSLARAVLSGQGQALSQAERRILILCDGRRDVAQLLAMLGPEAAASIQLLAEQGYLTSAVAAPTAARSTAAGSDDAPARPLAAGLGRLLQRGREAVASAVAGQGDASAPSPSTVTVAQTARVATAAIPPPPTTVPAPLAQAPASPPAPARNSRRSLVACKMYLLDMLQLQRSVEAAAMAVDIQTARGEDELLTCLLDTLAWLHAGTKPGIFQRIAERVHDTLPEAHLPRLQSTMAALDTGTAAAANVVAIGTRASTAGSA